jgi:hypothetical protein
MPSYSLNRSAVAHVRRLITGRRYVLDSDWGEAQPTAADETGSWRATPGRSTATGTSA